jgi:phytanoyl-CoA hydroxylase
MSSNWYDDGYIIFEQAIRKEILKDFVYDFEHKNPDTCYVCSENQPGVITTLTEAQARLNTHYRITNFEQNSSAAKIISTSLLIKNTLTDLWGKHAKLLQTLTFEFGSEQRIHQDWPYVLCSTNEYLAGAWIAINEVTENNGPLFYYPGSHKIPRYNFNGNITDYEFYLTEHFERKTFLAQPGDILLWHGDLIHGGSPVNDMGSNRLSFICHYSVEN